ncbi:MULTISPECIES: dynamin family protein [Pseudomonas]|uniref:dynamin family protein n=1 Tax=Pseudomonas TaxID=286 RepID=UPI001E2F2A02|nr:MULTISPECIES: dynamin family protein [Pseudomonas]
MTTDTFDVLVLATMSAGKTSFINALIGQELLHTANEATTACMTSVEHRQGTKYFSGACYSYSDIELARQPKTSAELVRNWNANAEVKRITLAGSFKIVPRPAPGLVLHDTPGPNNSQDDGHAQLMLEAVRTVSFKALCYVLNASQLGTQDDRAFLEQLRDELASKPGHPIYFILNKVDLLDPERGEDITTYVSSVYSYLTAIGFEHPMIIPTMASTALYARKALKAETLTRTQRSKLRQALDDLGDNKRALLHATVVPDFIKKRVFKTLASLERQHQAKPSDEQACEKNELQQLVAISGLKTVEILIKHQRQSVENP